MRVLLVDFDSKIPNLALMKLSAYYKQIGDEVGFDIQDPDKIYCSVIFSKNKGQAAGLTSMFSDSEIVFGGPGWDLKNKLPLNIELIKPDYDLYPSHFSQGFTTRGCIRSCPFCIVREKEGLIQIAQHPSEFHDERFDTCMIMDNNLLSSYNWAEKVLKWFNECGIKMLSPQGWDARLLDENLAGLLKDIKHPKGLHFAWDNTKDEKSIINAISLLKKVGFDLKHNVSFYVLAGYNSPFEDALYRCNRIKESGCSAFVMPYHKKDKQINQLARWANRRWAYWSGSFTGGTA